jgi:SAM-dependent methyltransferase
MKLAGNRMSFMNSEITVFIDSAKPASFDPWIEVRGWLASDQDVTRVSIPLQVKQSMDWQDRADVKAALPEKSCVKGFVTRLKADTVHLDSLELLVETENGCHTFPIQWSLGIKNEPQPEVDSPQKKDRLAHILTHPGTNQALSSAELEHHWTGNNYNFLTEDLSSELRVDALDFESAHGYPAEVIELIEENAGELILDCGAGLRRKLFSNVVNFEPVPYESTDVQGIAEALPFADNSFAAVVSLSVLEHVKDPQKAAKEMIRVLKPGGYIHLEVPFLIQEHGFPHHYYNMTTRGLANLVESECTVIDQQVPSYGHPLYSLIPMLETWCNNLETPAKETFEKMTVGELLKNKADFKHAPWVTQLSQTVLKRIATVTRLVAIKKGD